MQNIIKEISQSGVTRDSQDIFRLGSRVIRLIKIKSQPLTDLLSSEEESQLLTHYISQLGSEHEVISAENALFCTRNHLLNLVLVLLINRGEGQSPDIVGHDNSSHMDEQIENDCDTSRKYIAILVGVVRLDERVCLLEVRALSIQET